jgi:hypothetical protein
LEIISSTGEVANGADTLSPSPAKKINLSDHSSPLNLSPSFLKTTNKRNFDKTPKINLQNIESISQSR